ncbi:hypothetical protein V5799_014647 [Amblyomma americanum]|uniref:Uncharacterized protein n=1 Tax=Amblyomma americanum TaxID=6943 RepID=A0AAQ4E2F0_AMBAM
MQRKERSFQECIEFLMPAYLLPFLFGNKPCVLSAYLLFALAIIGDETTIFFRLCLYALKQYALRMQPLFVGMHSIVLGLSLILPSTLVVIFSTVFIDRFVTTVSNEILGTDQRNGVRLQTSSNYFDGGQRPRYGRKSSVSTFARRVRSVSVSDSGTLASEASGSSLVARPHRRQPSFSTFEGQGAPRGQLRTSQQFQSNSTSDAYQLMPLVGRSGASKEDTKLEARRPGKAKQKGVPHPNSQAKVDPVPVPKSALKSDPRAEEKPEASTEQEPEQRPEVRSVLKRRNPSLQPSTGSRSGSVRSWFPFPQFENEEFNLDSRTTPRGELPKAVVTETPVSFYVVPVSLAASINVILPVSLPLIVMREYAHANSAQMVAYGVFIKCVAVTAIFLSMNTIGLVVFQGEQLPKQQAMGTLHNTTDMDSAGL